MQVCVLISSVSGDLTVKGRTSFVGMVLSAHGVSPNEIDAADPACKGTRDILFKASGVRGNFPQVFLHDSSTGSYVYIPFEQLEAANEDNSSSGALDTLFKEVPGYRTAKMEAR